MKMKKRQVKKSIPKLRVKRGDTVRILAGRDRGKKGAILAVLPERGRVVVEGVNKIQKHIKARSKGRSGQRVEVAAPIHVSNVQLIDPSTKRGTRVRLVRENGERQRVAVDSGKTID